MERTTAKWLWLLPGVGFWTNLIVSFVWSVIPGLNSVVPVLWLTIMAWIAFMYSCIGFTVVCFIFAIIETARRRTSYNLWIATIVNASPVIAFLPFLIDYFNHLQEFFGSLPPSVQ